MIQQADHSPETKNTKIQGGYHWIRCSYSELREQLPFWSEAAISKRMRAIEQQGILISGNYNRRGFDRTKWYTIDYEVLDRLLSPFAQNSTPICSNRANPFAENEQTYTKEYTNTSEILNVLNGAVLKDSTTQQPNSSRKPFDRSILEKQIIKACYKQGIDDCSDFVEIITFYYEAYMRTFHKEHPRLSTKAMDDVVSALCYGSEMVEDIHPETYEAMIERHFQTEYSDCDYNICHFMTEGIRNNRFYESCY